MNRDGSRPDSEPPLTAAGFSPADSGTGDSQTLQAAAFEPLASGPVRTRRLSPAWLALGGVSLALLLCLVFLLMARSLEIAVQAEGSAEIRIDGLAIPLGNRYLIRPGEYAVTVKVPGYRDWAEPVVVTDADSQRLEVTPAILPGRVSITSTPSGASLTLSDEAIGATPLEGASLEAGDFELSLALPRYQTLTVPFTVTGRGIEQTLSLELAPDWAMILLQSNPPGAAVYEGEEPLGEAGSPLSVLSGQRTLTVRAPGYQDELVAIEVVAGVDQDLGTFELTPADGVLSLTSSPTNANVTVDGAFAGRTPISIDLSPGEDHLIQLSRAGYSRKSLQVSLDKGEVESQQVVLAPQLGAVTFELSPESAELFINGKSRGSGSQTLSLPAVEQRVEVRLAGYATQRSRVVPRTGLSQLVEVALLTEAEARKAALKPEITSALGQTLLLIDPVGEPMDEFSMGASRREPGRRSNEVVHSVRLERAFYMATTETTNAQFRQFEASHDSGQIEGNSLNREHQPAVQLSWQQAASFCNWLSQREGLPPFYRENQGIIVGFNPSSTGYRLPTEAEWSFASRVEGESYRRFAWGEEFPPSKAVVNVADNTSALVTGRILNGYADGHIVSAPVATFPANHRGLFDMGGNVAEWAHDVYAIPSANAEVATDPLGPLNGDNYTVRGASWALSRLSELRLTFRDYGARGRDDLGFRIARYAE